MSLIDRKSLFTVLFASSVLVANVTASKLTYIELPYFGLIGVTAAFVPFGMALLFSDVLNEEYGEEYARRVVNSTLIGLSFAYVIIWFTIFLPSAPFYESGQEYTEVLGASTSVMVASVVTFAITQHIDISLFTRIKDITGNRFKFARNIGSTFISQFADTVVFVSLAFLIIPSLQGLEALAIPALITLIVGEYIVKLVVAAIDTPLFYLLTGVRE